MRRLTILAALLACTSTANASYLWTNGDSATPVRVEAIDKSDAAGTEEIGGSGVDAWFARLLGYLWAM